MECEVGTALLEFHESYRGIDWAGLLQKANGSLIIAVYYWDKWVKQHERELRRFLDKGGAIQFFFSSQLEEVQKLFPGNTVDELKGKIERTYKPLVEYAGDKVKVGFVPRLLNYSMQCIDNRFLVMSFFEMYRSSQADSPGFVVDLEKSNSLNSFYRKELDGFVKEALIL